MDIWFIWLKKKLLYIKRNIKSKKKKKKKKEANRQFNILPYRTE